MLGPKSLLSSLIAKGLTSVLVIDQNKIESCLLSKDGRMALHNVEIRPIKIAVSRKLDVVTFLTVTGTVRDIEISWTWSSKKVTVERSSFSISGVRLKVTFHKELDPSYDEHSHMGGRVDLHPEPEKKKKKSAVARYLGEELERLKSFTIGHIRESSVIQQSIQELLDSLCLKVSDLEIHIINPEPDVKDDSWEPSTVVVNLVSLSYGSRRNYNDEPTQRPMPFMLEFRMDSLYANLLAKEVLPILEPFSYSASVRRVTGQRFRDMKHGYEVMGHETDAEKYLSQATRGMVFHLSTDQIRVFSSLGNALSGDDDQKENFDADIETIKKEPPRTTKWPISAKLIVLFVVLCCLVTTLTFLVFLVRYFEILQEDKLIFVWVAGGFPFVVSSLALLVPWRLSAEEEASVPNFISLAASVDDTVKNVPKEPAVFRVPIPRISVVLSRGVRLDVLNVCALGRIGSPLLSISARTLNLTDPREEESILLLKSIKANVKSGKILANIDSIEEAHFPGVIRLRKPSKYVVVRFESQKLKVKFKDLDMERISTCTNKTEEPSTVVAIISDYVSEMEKMGDKIKETGNKITDTGMKGIQRGVDLLTGGHSDSSADESGELSVDSIALRQLRAEAYTEIRKLKIVAQMFEEIKLAKNRHKLRLYPNTFRGISAVNFVLTNKMAESRVDAVKLLTSIQSEFNLFQHITMESKFRDDYDCIYFFVPKERRRFWDQIPYSYEEIADEVIPEPLLPFSLSISCKEININDYDNFVFLKGADIYLQPGKMARALDVTVWAEEISNQMGSVWNGRIHAMIDPDIPKQVHRFQFSVDSLRVNPKYSMDDFYKRFGFTETKVNNRTELEKEPSAADAEPIALPYAFIPPFNLHLSYKGVLLNANESVMSVKAFNGTANTTSNDLIIHFLKNVLGRAPGMLGTVRVAGVNVVQSTGMVTAINIGMKAVPFGQYIGIGAVAAFDGITGALDAGKEARRDPNGTYKIGDAFRGIKYGAGQAARAGAQRRGKTSLKDEFYDDEDQVELDAVDFAIGSAESMFHYANSNKARFAGATVAGATMVAMTVVTGPVGGILVGVAAGQTTEWAVNRFERFLGLSKENADDSSRNYGDDDGDADDGNTMASF